MINLVHRKDLNLDKYNNCIGTANNTRVYAYSWYLDEVTEHYDVLVEDDYVAVMPLPYRKKLGIHYIFIPPWTQQLGVFSTRDYSKKYLSTFLAAIPKKFKHITINFNAANVFDKNSTVVRTNYILDLTPPYEQLVKRYSKGRKSDLKKAKQFNFTIKQVTKSDTLITLFKTIKGDKVRVSTTDYEKLKALTNSMSQQGTMAIIEVLNESLACIGGAIFLIDAKRITYLFSVSNAEGRKKQVISAVIDRLIKKYANSSRLFDFEGSDSNVRATFFKSFGALKELYFYYKKVRL